MQVYMALTGMTRAMYLAVNKDNDELYSERVNADADEAKRLIEKQSESFLHGAAARRQHPPDWYECKMCDHYDLSARHSRPAPDMPQLRACNA